MKKTITIFHSIDAVVPNEDKSAALARLCRKLRNGGMPIYYGKLEKEIMVQSGHLTMEWNEDLQGWNFTWSEE